MEYLTKFFQAIIYLWAEMAPYLLLGVGFAGLLHVFIAKNLINRHLGKLGIFSIIKATLLGVPLPVCSCGVIPLAASLRKDGAHKSNVLAFLISTPTTGVDSILATYALLGPVFAIFRPLAAIVAGIIVGILDYLFSVEAKTNFIPRHEHIQLKFSDKIKELVRYCFWEVPQDIGKWLIVGTVLGAAITAFIPNELLSSYLKFPWDFAAALAIGLPLYVCATGSIPIAVSLLQKGFSPGAALVFLIAGPATNTITMAFVRAKLGKQSFYLYIFSIVITAVVMGLGLNYFWQLFGAKIDFIHNHGTHLPQSLKYFCAVVLAGLVINSLFKKNTCLISADLEISLADIHCQQCKMVLEKAIKEIPAVERVVVDVESKKIFITGSVDKNHIRWIIKQAGYTPLN
jgi:hypothetical protein